MTFDELIAEIEPITGHDHEAIAQFAQRAISYSRALESGEITPDEYRSLLADIQDLKGMAEVDRDIQHIRTIQECVTLMSSLV